MNSRSKIRLAFLTLVLLALILSAACTSTSAPTSERVSVATNGTQPDKDSKQPSISANGRYAAFASDATNLVDGDTNGVTDVFVRDLDKGTTTRVSVASDGTQGDKASYWPYISSDGRYVTFTSEADNLVVNDTNGVGDVFLYDRKTGDIQMASVGSDGTPGNDLSFWSSTSSDGRYVAFMSNATNLVSGDKNDAWDIFLRDTKSRQTSLVSMGYDGKQANSQSEYPILSANGRFIAFASDATNIVNDDTNGYRDVFEYDRSTGKTVRISLSSDGKQANRGTEMFVISISADGQYVAFASLASNLVPDDTNQVWDIFVRALKNSQTTRVSVSSLGTQANAGSYGVSISADGRYVVFGSNASNLVDGDTNEASDVFVHDRQTGQTQRVSVSGDGTQGDQESGYALIVTGGIDIAYGSLISSDGRKVVFMSKATNLVSGDTNGKQDIFVHSR